MKLFSILFLTGGLLYFQTASNSKLNGKWMMHQVFQNNEEVTAEHNPYNERYVVFEENGSFKSDGRPFGMNTGTYTYSSTDSTLYLNSDAGEDDDSYWKVFFDQDTMIWNGFGSEWAQGFQLIHVKSN